MRNYCKTYIIFLTVLLILFAGNTFGLKMTQMPEEGQTKIQEPQGSTFSLKLPLQQPDYHWTFMSKEDFLSGKLVLRVIRDRKNEEIVIFDKGNFSDGWKEMSEQKVEGRGEIYFGFISTKKFLTAPGDKLELELTVTKNLSGIGPEQSGILPAGIYKSTGKYSGLIDNYDTSALEKTFEKSSISEDQKQKLLETLHSSYDYKAFMENWEVQWSLNITRQKGWLTDEQLLQLDEARSRLINSSNKNKPNISGIVRDQEGEPVPDAIVILRPLLVKATQTDKEGKFEFYVRPGSNSMDDNSTPYLIARHRERNLAAAVKLGDNTEGLEIQLSTGAIISGKVVDINGTGLPQARIQYTFMESDMGYGENEPLVIGANGDFQLRSIPIGYKFSISARAEGYGSSFAFINTDKNLDNPRVSEPLVLKIANFSVTGIVVDRDNKPVTGANINSYGNDQEPRFAETDSDGKFILEGLCEGKIQIFATKGEQNIERGGTEAQAGAKDVKIMLLETFTREISQKTQSVSLLQKQLPRIENIFLGFKPEKIKDKKVLVCFWDYEQRPSRNCILQLAKQAEQLKEKDVEIIAVQASKIDLAPFDKWIQENNIPFTIGVIPSDEEKTRTDWGVKSLPWLILTDKNHKVTAEGFGIAELDEKIGKN